MRYNIKFDIVKSSKFFFLLSGIITVLGIIALVIFSLNFGVDFKAGTSLDIDTVKTVTNSQVTQIVQDAGFKAMPIIVLGGNPQTRVTLRFDKVLNLDEVNQVMAGFTKEFGKQVSHSENTVDVEIAKELGMKAIIAILIASLGIIIYVSIRFEWRFAVAAVVALLHDAFIVISLFSIFRWEVDLPFIAAVLTIIGYSINDTIVIFDRIRENMRYAKVKNFSDLKEVVNHSIWQTMTRSINTVLTVLVGAVCLLIFGSESIHSFSIAMIIGLVSGAYSSIFIASSLWLLMKNNSLKHKSAKRAVPVK